MFSFKNSNKQDFATKNSNINTNLDCTAEETNETRDLLDDDLTEDDINEIYLSLFWVNNQLGASYYDSNRQTIFHLDDIQESIKFEVILLLIEDIRPECVIVSSKTDEKLTSCLKKTIDENKILLTTNNDYNFEFAKKRIMQLKLNRAANLNLTNDIERFVYFSSFLNFDATLMIRSMGALIKYLDKNRINVQLEEKTIHTPIVSFKSIKLDDVLLIDQNSLKSLQIFHSVSHPSAYKQNSKEGLSLFNIYYGKLQTKLGAHKLRSWLLKPTRNQNILSNRHEIIEFFIDPRNQDFTRRISSLLRNCKNMSLIFKRLKVGQPNFSDWHSLFKTTENLIKLISVCDELRKDQTIRQTSYSCSASMPTFKNTHDTSNFTSDNLFDKFLDTNNNNEYFKILNDIFNLMSKVVDFKGMIEHKKFCVLPSVDEDLDNKRNLILNLSEILVKVTAKERESLNISECNVVYMPQLGFQLVINNIKQIEKEDDRAKFEFEKELALMFINEKKYFYKNKLMKYLDQKFGDLATDINNIERKIMFELQTAISDYNYVYAYLVDLCSEIDVCLAFSKVAVEYNYVKPIFDKDKTCFIYATKTRHPLLELVVNSFVPNDVSSGLIPKLENQFALIDETNTVKVLTGTLFTSC